MAVGAHGAGGAPAVRRAAGGHRDGLESLTTLLRPMGAVSVRAPARKPAVVTQDLVLSFS